MIAVASGKGGVGKSSLTANLAAAFAAPGRRVGILDADIYGHSIPHMLGIQQKPVLVDKLMIPPVAHDLKLMSIGFFVDDNKPLMWRGPMLHRALEQFLQDVHWGELDVLVVDMPPGTGDVSISLGQMLPRAEAVVVTTPQLLAQEVASRAAQMARRTGMQLLGVIENMTSEVFGTGGGERLATELGVKLLGIGAARRAHPRGGRRRDAARRLRPRVASLRARSPRSRREIDSSRGAGLHAHAAARLLTRRTLARLAALGFSADDAAVLADHFLDAEARGRTGHGLVAARVCSSGCPSSTRPRGRAGSSPSRATSAGTGTARSATSC